MPIRVAKVPAMLEPPFHHFVSAARGWLELGCLSEARAELHRLPEAIQQEPEVLEVCWDISAAEKNWDEAWHWGELLVDRFPEDPGNWIQRAYAARRATSGGLAKAWDALRPAFERFPREVIIPYNLACYAAQSGELEDAWSWLGRAMERADDRRAIKKMALADEDLKGLWNRLKNSS